MALKILVVDDISQNISSLIDAISSENISFVPAKSGKDALRILSQTNDFDLALVDVQMPEMDGFELVTLMKGVDRTKNIPVIFITAQSPSQYSQFKGYDVGAIDFIYKPINIKMLKSKIDVFHRLKVKRLKLNEKIKELEAAKEKLEVSERKAKEADALKSAFLAHMSHEIRTPITALIGFAELLKDTVGGSPLANEYVHIILKNGQHLLELVNGILDLSKVEAGQLDVELSEVNFRSMLEEVLALLQPLFQANHVSLHLDSSLENESVFCHVDTLRAKQILTNVIGNAVKFSPSGSVSLSLERDSETGPASAKFIVKDSGVGIPPEERDRLFKPFSQLTAKVQNQKFPGTGLGLSLSKKLAQLQGGDVYLADSAPGKGSTFVVALPLCESKATCSSSSSKSSRPEAVSHLNGYKVLLADDSVDNRLLIETFLGHLGASVESVENGRELVDIMNERAPDIILMDYKMPILDGLSATRALRKKGKVEPIILLTANAMKGEREAALEAGATDYVSKPIDWRELIQKIQAACVANSC